MKRTGSILTIVLLLILAGFFIEKRLHQKSSLSINLEGLALQDLNGKNIATQQFLNNPTVINFWGTWCGPCLQELPGFENAGKKFAGKINIVMVSDEPADKIAAFKTRNNYQLLYAHSQKNFDSLGIAAVPVTCFFDATGKLLMSKEQALDEKELTTAIESLMK